MSRNVIVSYISGFDGDAALAVSPSAVADSVTTCYNTAATTAAYSITFNGGNGANCALSFRMRAGD